MATEVNFYHLTKSSLEDALPRLLLKTLQAGERAVVMLGSPERVDALNTHLWTFDHDSFLPHGAAEVAAELDAAGAEPGEPSAADTLEEMKAKMKAKKSGISAEMMDTANTYDDKVALIRMLVAEDSGRVANVLKGMIKVS
jgi:DNA polymerase IIIc chi subunit